MRYRQSRPPIEWARKLIPLEGALERRNLSKFAAREVTEPVLQRYSVTLSTHLHRAHAPWYTCNQHLGTDFIAQNAENSGPVMLLQDGKGRWPTDIETIQPYFE